MDVGVSQNGGVLHIRGIRLSLGNHQITRIKVDGSNDLLEDPSRKDPQNTFFSSFV